VCENLSDEIDFLDCGWQSNDVRQFEMSMDNFFRCELVSEIENKRTKSLSKGPRKKKKKIFVWVGSVDE
jgi:hypothetical protein